MKLSLIFSTLASIVVLATAYPTQGTIANRSNVEKRKDDDFNLFNYNEYDKQTREEHDFSLFNYNEYDEQKHEEYDANL
ncbi:hypothetical protein BDR04DRAFT_1230600 [Suillus decipiens]|nr:hypothetical protein BDR04DRAFT_1230600 [Suillus decipiens]